MKPQRPLLTHLKDWWWLYGAGSALCGLIVLWGGIPPRLAKAEDALEKTKEDVSDLKGWAREVQGYTRAMQQQQQAPNQAAPYAAPAETFVEEDANGRWCCTAASLQECDDRGLWRVCE